MIPLFQITDNPIKNEMSLIMAMSQMLNKAMSDDDSIEQHEKQDIERLTFNDSKKNLPIVRG